MAMTWGVPFNGSCAMPPSHPASMGIGAPACNVALNVGTSAVWPTANLAIFHPFYVRSARTAIQMYTYNGVITVTPGNVDVGIYSSDGTRLVSIGTTALVDADNVLQLYNITDTVLLPGNYWMAMAVDNTADAFFRVTPGGTNAQIIGARSVVSSFVLPATVAMPAVNVAQNYMPLFGVTFNGVI